MKLWGGRFKGNTDELAFSFNESLSFDRRLYREDIEGSLAHVKMLAKQGILTEEERDRIADGLVSIRERLDSGALQFDGSQEDIHSFIEGTLTAEIGEAGKKLHTGRSRNDQVAVDMKLYTRRETDEIITLTTNLIDVIRALMQEHKETYMPGFTHLQKAQPVTLAHHLGAYEAMLLRDVSRLTDTRKRMNECPLGAGALAGTTYDLDREYTAALLGFDKATENSMDSVSDRDYIIELLSDLSILMMHLSRFSEEIILWNSNEYGFIELDDAYSTGSSIMPQKKNPDIAELVRGKTGRIYGHLMQILTTMKGLPLAYNKDMQEDKEGAFDAIDNVKPALILFAGMLSTMRVNNDAMAKSAMNGFTNATDAAEYLVNHGIPFRDAHGIIGGLVLTCIERGCSLLDLSMEDYKSACSAFEEDIYDAISLKTCVSKRLTKGAPGELIGRLKQTESGGEG